MSFGEFFLKNPGAFVSGIGATPWGQETVGIRIAGIRFLFTGLSPRQAEWVRHHHAEFLDDGPEDMAPVVTQIFRADPAVFRPFETRGWTYTLDMDYQPEQVRIAGLGFMAILECAPALSGQVWTSTEQESTFGKEFSLVFGNFFRLTAAYAAVLRGGVMLHSAGVSDGKRAWIGFGRSGAGKSTFSSLSLAAGQQVLSDDINLLHEHGGRWHAKRLPFAGDLGPTHGDDREFPIAGILRLHKGEAHRLEPLGRLLCLAALVGSSPYVNRDPLRVERLMSNLESLLAVTPSYDLSFRKDAGFWSLLNACP